MESSQTFYGGKYIGISLLLYLERGSTPHCRELVMLRSGYE